MWILFNILVGPNARGKSTFLVVAAFLSDILRAGPAKAILGDRRTSISQRASDPKHLFWMRQGGNLQLAVELPIPEERRRTLPNGGHALCRYEAAAGLQPGAQQMALLAETLWLRPETDAVTEPIQKALFPSPMQPPADIVIPPGKKTPSGWRKVINRVESSGNDYFSSETSN